MKKLLPFFSGVFLCCGVWAQDTTSWAAYKYTLETVYKKAYTSEQKVDALLSLSEYYSDYANDSLQALGYAQKALSFSLNAISQGKAYLQFANIYIQRNGPKAAIFYDKASTVVLKNDSKEALSIRSRVWIGRAFLISRKAQSKKNVDILLSNALPLALQSGDSAVIAKCYYRIGLPFHNNGEQKKAIMYFNKAIGIYERNSIVNSDLVYCYSSVARASLNIGDTITAKQYLARARPALRNSHYENHSAVFYHSVEATYYSDTRLWDKAKLHIDTALAIAQHSKSLSDKAFALDVLWYLYKKQKNYKALKEVLTYFYTRGFHLMVLHDKVRLLNDLATAEAALGNKDKAYDWFIRYKVLSDSLNSRNTAAQITEYESRYNYIEKEKELLQISNESKNQRIVLLITLFSFFIGGLVVFYLIRQRKLKVQQLQKIAIEQALLEGEERERQRIARDLHDGLAGTLSGIKLKLSEQPKNPAAFVMDEVNLHLENSISELRRIARNLMPETLVRFGLELALQDLCHFLSSKETAIEYHSNGIKKNISTQNNVNIYRIVQELLSNSIRHGKAGKILVQCLQNQSEFFITVEDKGQGFDLKKPRPGNGMGLGNIQNRVKFMKGRFDIESAIGEGTTVNIELHV